MTNYRDKSIKLPRKRWIFNDRDLDVLLTVHLTIFILVSNELDAQHVWYHHTYRCDDTTGCI